MKWFKHMSQAHTDDKLVRLRSMYGMWGIGVYWTIVEKVAEQMKANDPTPKAVFTVQELCSYFVVRPRKLSSYLLATRQLRLIYAVTNGNLIEIEIPKLLEIKDNYTKDLEVSSKQEVEVEVEEEVDTEKEKREKKKADARPDSLEEVKTFFRENGSTNPDGEKFWNHFESNGWKVGGRAPMKNWKAAARNWISRRFSNEPPSKPKKPAQKIENTYDCSDCQKMHVVGSAEEKACIERQYEKLKSDGRDPNALVAAIIGPPEKSMNKYQCEKCGGVHSPRFVCARPP